MMLLSILKLFTTTLFAGQIFLYISDGKPCDKPMGNEYSVHRVTSTETIAHLKNYFESKTLDADYSAAIVNAGLKFCGEAEQRKVFGWMLDGLSTPTPSKSTWEVLRNYHRMKIFKEEFQKRKTKPAMEASERKNLARVEAWYSR